MITVYFECGDLAYESPVPKAKRIDAEKGFLHNYNVIKCLAEDSAHDYIIYTNSLIPFGFENQKTYIRDKNGWVDIHQSEYVDKIADALIKLGNSYLISLKGEV